MKPMLKKIIIFIIIAIIIIAAYVIFFGGGGSTSGQSPLVSSTGATDTSGGNTAASPVDPAFLTTLLGLNTINLDTSIFQDPSFNSLEDLSVPLGQPDPQGRPNPFAPIGNNGGAPSANVTITTVPATTITKTTAVLNASISDATNATGFWFEMGRTQTTLTASPVLTQASATGTWSYTVEGLLPKTLYYVRAGATVAGATVYGQTITFTTLAK